MSGSSPTADGYYDQPAQSASAANPYYQQQVNPVDPAVYSGVTYGYGHPSYGTGSPMAGGLQQESDIRGGVADDADGQGRRRRTSSLSRERRARGLDDDGDDVGGAGQYGLDGAHEDERGYGVGAGGILGDDGLGELGHAITLAEPFSNDINAQDPGHVGGIGLGPSDDHHHHHVGSPNVGLGGDPMGMHGGSIGHEDDLNAGGGYRSEMEDTPGDGTFMSGGDLSLGGANAKVNDDKLRKRIIQACEPCRIRKAKCNGLQPCVRCGARNLSCDYAHERRMRGPNRMKRTTSEKAASASRRKREKAIKEAQKNGTALPLDDAVVIDADGQYQDEATMASQIAAAAHLVSGATSHPGSPRVKEEPGLEPPPPHSSMGLYDSGVVHAHGHGISSWSGGSYGNQWDRNGTSASRGHAQEEYDRSERGWHDGDHHAAGVAPDYGGYAYQGPQYTGEPPSPATAAQHEHGYAAYQPYPARDHQIGDGPIMDDPRNEAFAEADLDSYGAEQSHATYDHAEPVVQQVAEVRPEAESVVPATDGQATSGEVVGVQQVAPEEDASAFALFGEALAVQNAQEQEANGEGRWDNPTF